MLSVSLGPIALPLAPLALLLAILVAAFTSRLLAPAESARVAERTVWQAITLALISARLAYLALHWTAYISNPWSMIDIRDGGWSWIAGIIAGFAWIFYRAGRQPELRRALVVSGLVGLTLWGSGKGAIRWSENQPARRLVPPIIVTSLVSGEQKPLDELIRSRPAIVNLWATWCGPCRVEMPVLAAAQKRYPDITLVFLNQGETPAQISKFLSEEGLKLEHVWLDTQSQFGPAVGSQGLPTTIFYDRHGHRVDAHFGILSAAALRIQAERLISSLTE